MSDCSKHKKDVQGISDMKLLAEMIGDLHYESLTELLTYLSSKLEDDSIKDRDGGRKQLANVLHLLADEIKICARLTHSAYKISKPFMESKTSLDMDKNKLIKICEQVASDVEKDAKDFDGKPFDGKTVAKYFGYHGAAIVALADVIKTILSDQNHNNETV